jgi:hypothetical protein
MARSISVAYTFVPSIQTAGKIRNRTKENNNHVYKAAASLTMRRQPRREEAGAIEELE